MNWHNVNTNEWVSEKPVRIRMPDGTTRTEEAITDEDMAEAGWVFVDTQKLITDND